VLLFQLVLSANSAFGTICNGNTSTITFTTDSANSSAGTIGPASIDGYGNLSSSCYNVPGATCEVVLCDMDSMTVRMGSQNGWKFTITGDIGELLASEGGHDVPFPTWLDGNTNSNSEWQTYNLLNAVPNISLLPDATASQSSTNSDGTGSDGTVKKNGSPDKVIDGNTDGRWQKGSVSRTQSESSPYWKVKFEAAHRMNKIKVWNRTDVCCNDRILGFVLSIHLNGNEIWSSSTSTSSSVDTSTIANSYEFPIDDSVHGDEVIVTLPGDNKVLSLAEVEVFGFSTPLYNVALHKHTSQSSNSSASAKLSFEAVNGSIVTDPSQENFAQTFIEQDPWWEVFLGMSADIETITIYSRDFHHPECPGDVCSRRLRGFRLEIFNGNDENAIFIYNDPSAIDPGLVIPIAVPSGTVGDRVRISLQKQEYLGLREVQVFSETQPITVYNVALNKSSAQSSTWTSSESFKAVDGEIHSDSNSHTDLDLSPWWEVLLGSSVVINSIFIYNNCDIDNCSGGLRGFRLEIFNGDDASAVFTYNDPSAVDPGPLIPITTGPSGIFYSSHVVKV